MTTRLEAAHQRLKQAQIALALFTHQTKGRDLNDHESAEQQRLLQEETDAKQNLYAAEHSGS